VVREAVSNDAGAVIALWEACGLTRPWNDPRADFDRALAFAGSTVLVIEDAGAVIGSVMTGYDGHRGWIYYLGVHPDRQREGHARAAPRGVRFPRRTGLPEGRTDGAGWQSGARAV